MARRYISLLFGHISSTCNDFSIKILTSFKWGNCSFPFLSHTGAICRQECSGDRSGTFWHGHFNRTRPIRNESNTNGKTNHSRRTRKCSSNRRMAKSDRRKQCGDEHGRWSRLRCHPSLIRISLWLPMFAQKYSFGMFCEIFSCWLFSKRKYDKL